MTGQGRRLGIRLGRFNSWLVARFRFTMGRTVWIVFKGIGMAASATTRTILQELEAGKRRRRRKEALLAFLFVAPATIVTFVFGIWPVIFGFFVSLHQWRARSHNFLGLDQYVRALGNAAYVLVFFLCVLFLYGGYRALKGLLERAEQGVSFYPFLIPGFILALGTIVFAIGFAAQDGGLMVPGMILLAAGGALYWALSRREGAPADSRTGLGVWQLNLLWLLALGLFLFTISEILHDTAIAFMITAAAAPDLYLPPLSQQMALCGGAVLALIAIVVIRWWRRRLPDEYAYDRGRFVLQLATYLLAVVVFFLVVYLISAMQFDQQAASAVRDMNAGAVTEIGQAVTGLERDRYRPLYGTLDGENLANMLLSWPQIMSVSLGFILMFTAYRVWRQASGRETGMGTSAFILLTILLAVGGWLLIGELPQALAVGDIDYYNSLLITTTYVLGTVPMQLVLGLLLAYIMFYEISLGKSLFRVIYFLPYVAPTVATATVFGIIFSSRSYSLSNQALALFGIRPLGWLYESKGIFQLLAEMIAGPQVHLPVFLVGPSLALVSITLYSIWVFSGYNSVIFLAGLGAIPFDLYEAAKVDGAGRWAAFRKITLPLLSPTTFFLIILSITGTFRAFNHIYVMRQAAARGTADTATVHIFVQFWQFNQWGYAAAMAFVLFGIILILTLVQNELSKERVFYG
jgi:ABC-type sugar transport system permease subunit